MPCDTSLRQGQTLSQRKEEVKSAVAKLEKALVAGRARVVVSKEGAIAFAGWIDEDRDRVTDSCAYRRIMVTGSALAKAAIAKAEMLAGRPVDRKLLAQGVHSHDGGATFHKGH